MKKIAAIGVTALAFLTNATTIFAQAATPFVFPTGTSMPNINVKKGPIGIDPDTAVGVIVSNAITVVLIFASLAVLIYLIMGAFQWITSGGDKEAVGKARGRIIAALTGLLILALAFLIARLAGFIAGYDLFNLPCPPSLSGKPNPC